MKISRLLFLSSILASSAVQADEWIGPYTVTYIENGANGVFFMRDDQGVGQYSSTYSCNKSTIWFPATLTDPVIGRITATGLAAQATGLRVKFLVNGCNSYLTARAISIDPNY